MFVPAFGGRILSDGKHAQNDWVSLSLAPQIESTSAALIFGRIKLQLFNRKPILVQ